ncbi:MAG TPA: tetratricopeptide repeat protein [Blastocatellia bacterium]|nr:tetratricopeptide repeat protein [Blastocatellia bacterium]
MSCDVLIITATEVESEAVLQVFKEATGEAVKPVSIDKRMYHDLGIVNGASVYLAQSQMGSGGPGASQQTVQRGIDALKPSSVIMVGIAFGINSKKQSIGDILVSQQLMLYDLQRVGRSKEGQLEIILRGDRPRASSRLLNFFQGAHLHWDKSKAKVRFGLVLSGEKLVDNIDFRDQLKAFEQEAIGGEMEGAGLYVASYDENTDWILVKAICDWADGNKKRNKSKYQQKAAHNSASFVLHVLTQASFANKEEPRPSLIREWPNVPPAPEVAERSSDGGRSSLPHQPYFFGRDKELKIIADALLPESRNWGVLIDGPGGIGKTSLAIRAGHLAPSEHFPLKIFLSAKVREMTPAGEQPLEDYLLPNFISLITELARELGEGEIARMAPNERANEVRRALTGKQALIIIDNIETFGEHERVRLYQFLSRLPGGCKAIVTSRRRSDIDARIIRLDRLLVNEALDLMNELSKNNRHLARASETERHDLYAMTNGNPLLIKWVASQMGREGSQCRTIAEACEFMKSAPKDNDPLEYIFGDLLDTFTANETAVLAALTHFTQPAKVEWIAELAGLSRPAAQTALEDLADRALLVSDEATESFFLPPLAAVFLRRKRPEAVAATGNRLTNHVYALVMENGYQKHERFPNLENDWPTIAAALPLFLQGENARLQRFCDAMFTFLYFSGHLDELTSLSQKAEEKALAAGDFQNAGWRAYQLGCSYYWRGQVSDVLICATRCEELWQKAAATRQKATAIRLRGLGHRLEKKYPAAITAFQEALALHRTQKLESKEVAGSLNDLAGAEKLSGDYAAAERDYLEALRIAKKLKHDEGVATYTGNLAELALEHKNWSAAETLAREAVSLGETISRQELIGYYCCILAQALAHQGRLQESLPYARRAVDVFTRLRSPNLGWAQDVLEECEEGMRLAEN